jgi:hypothetical protein
VQSCRRQFVFWFGKQAFPTFVQDRTVQGSGWSLSALLNHPGGGGGHHQRNTFEQREDNNIDENDQDSESTQQPGMCIHTDKHI